MASLLNYHRTPDWDGAARSPGVSDGIEDDDHRWPSQARPRGGGGGWAKGAVYRVMFPKAEM